MGFSPEMQITENRCTNLRRLLEYKKPLFLELGGKCPPFQGLQTLSVHFTAFYGVSEVATINDLEFPTLIDESENGNSFVVDCDAAGGGEQK